MFTDKDYMEYLESIIGIENEMLFYVNDLKGKVKDEALIGALEVIVSDETKHYAMARSLYSTFFPQNKDELAERDFSKGTILLKDPVTGDVIEGIMLLLSEDGYGLSVEVSKHLNPGDTYDVELSYRESGKKESGKGKIIWYKAIRPDLGLGCIDFKK